MDIVCLVRKDINNPDSIEWQDSRSQGKELKFKGTSSATFEKPISKLHQHQASRWCVELNIPDPEVCV